MKNSSTKIKEINLIIQETFAHFDVAGTNFSKAQSILKKGGANLPQAASYGLIVFGIVLILLQVIYLIVESLFNIDVGDFTFVGNLIPMLAGLGVYYYYNKKNKKEAHVFQKITDQENDLGKMLILNNFSTLEQLPVDYWTPTATQYLTNSLQTNSNITLEQAIINFEQMIHGADKKTISKYNKEIYQLNFILKDEEVSKLFN